MNKVSLILTLGLLTVATSWADAQTALQAARERYPATEIRSAVNTALPGIYAFDMGGETVYGDVSARYLLFGQLIDTQAPPVRDLYRQIADTAIELQSGSGGEVIIFTDPLCPYCAALEQRILAGELAGYRISMVLVPLQPGSYELSAAVLCETDPAQAWRKLMLGELVPQSCQTDKIDQHVRAAQQARIHATPSLLAPSGEILVGLPEAKQLANWAAREQQ